jgi:hypothetical protein
LDGWGIPRRRLLWKLGTLSYQEEELDLDVPVIDVALPELSRSEEVLWEHSVLGLSTADILPPLKQVGFRPSER